MKLERRSMTAAGGRRRLAPTWTIRLRCPLGVEHRLSAFKDKRASEELGRKIERLARPIHEPQWSSPSGGRMGAAALLG